MLSEYYDVDYAILKSLVLAYVLGQLPNAYHATNVGFALSNAIYNVHFNLISIDDINTENDNNYRKQNNERYAPVYQTAITVAIGNNQPSPWFENIEELSTFKKIKVKTRKAPISNDRTIVEEENAEIKQELHPGFFGEAYKELESNNIVAIDHANMGRNNSYFAIWNKPKIVKSIKKPDDWRMVDDLFKIFQTGNMAAKDGTSGIKLMRNLGIFEIKKRATSARVYGDEVVTVKGKTALVFGSYSQKGFHS